MPSNNFAKRAVLATVEKKNSWRENVGVLVAVAGLFLTAATGYYTLIQKRYDLKLIHPPASLKVQRTKDSMTLSISGDETNINAPRTTFVNEGNQPITITNVVYSFDLNTGIPPSCKHGELYVLADEKFKPIVVKAGDSVSPQNDFSVQMSFSDWTKLFKEVRKDIYALACISIDFSEAKQGAQKFSRIFGLAIIPKSSLDFFNHPPGPGAGMQVPIGMVDQNGFFEITKYTVWY
jgi:hypothetical protein